MAAIMVGLMLRSRRLVAASVALMALAIAATGVVLAIGSPAARWAFDETSGSVATDDVGSLHGTIDGATSIADGAVGRAFHFDGGDSVTIPDAASLRADEMTMDLWVRSDGVAPPTDGQVLLDKGSVLCGGAGYAMVVDGAYVAITYRELKGSIGIRTVTVGPTNFPTIWDGDWHHVSLISSRRSDGWGGVYVRIDGWIVGGTELGTVIGIDPGEAGAEPLVIGGDDDTCGPGFVGDVDQVRLFDSIVTADVLDVDEPTVATSIDIDAIGPTTINEASYVDVTLHPVPPRAGILRVYVTADDGIERAVGARDLALWELDPDGEYRIPFTTEYGGASTVTVRYVPTFPIPHLASQATAATTIAKKPSTTTIGLQQIYIAGEAIRIGVNVHASSQTMVTGVAELYEHADSDVVLLDSRTLTGRVGSLDDGFEVWLDGRQAGDYRFEARYLGGPAYLPSSSVVTTLTVEPALQAGPVTINGGAATTDDPIVTVSVPAVGATALWISTDLTDDRRFSTHPYTPEVTTWLTAPWYGDDADGVRTVWVKWADVLGRWSELQSDSIILDRTASIPDSVAPSGSITIAGGAAYSKSTAVTIAVPATDTGSGMSQVALSNDGVSWTTRTYAASQAWTLSSGNGTKTVRVKWKDVAGNWSAVKTDTIVLDSVAPAGMFAIASGAAYTRTTAVTLATAATDAASGVSQVALSNDGVTWTTRAYAASQAWTLSPGNGTKTVWVKWKDVAGNWSAVKSDTIVLDTVAPSATAPRRGFVAATSITSGRISVRMPWSGVDGTSGIARYELAQQMDGGAWTTISTTLTAPTATRLLAPLHTYRFRVRAVDKAGNTGAWATGATFRISRYSEFSSAIRYSGTWRTVSSPAYWGGAAKKSSTAGAKASLTFTGRSIAWVARTGPDRGKAQIYINGTKVATVDLYSPAAQAQRVVWVRSWTTSVSRKVTIRVAGTSGRPRIDLDALVTAN